MKNGVFFRTGAFFFFIFEPLGRFGPPMAQTKALAGAITEMYFKRKKKLKKNCWIVGEMSTNSSQIHLGSILVNSAVLRNCGKIQENALTVPQNDRSS